MTAVIVLIVIILIVAGYAISVYNRLISLKVKVQEAASDIDVQLKRRYDLIPNLIETVKGSSKFESETLERVIKARNSAMSIDGLSADKAAAEGALSGALRQLFALSESYPDLKSNQNYLQLQDELSNTEDRIVASRRFYNSVVSDYNSVQLQFPAILFRSLAGATEEDFFELEDPEVERKNPEVKF